MRIWCMLQRYGPRQLEQIIACQLAPQGGDISISRVHTN
jgi:hypothetical protein